ncbi:FAD-dependent oxidoreductase [Achromobacter veterisilvae]|uniref:FAD-dependent oxidoreductase n=1 Tax=Achromobacter veterisilvae TaxID=2069367 RepID=A0ABZ2RXZ9_9BURK
MIPNSNMRIRSIQLGSAVAMPSLARSHWFNEAGLGRSPRTRLTGRQRADVAIVGGGFVGLWTALAIKEAAPAAAVAVLEQDVCGGGASGRNGGFAMSWWPKIGTLLGISDRSEALRLAVESEGAVSALGKFCAEHGIDAHFTQRGWMWTATNDAQQEAWAGTLAMCQRLGRTPFKSLTPREVAQRSGSRFHLAGVIEPSNATVQPAALVAGLRRVALSKGIQIFERSRVDSLQVGPPAVLVTAEGELSASTVVIANNAWAVAIPELARLITPVSSAIVVTEPIPDRLKQIGWTGGEAITDSQLMVGYYRTTRDGRIVYGKGTGAIEAGRRIGNTFSRDPKALELTEADFRRAYPELSNVAIADKWSGPVDRTFDSLPVFGRLKAADHICYGVGWSGNGVAPSYIGGKILSSLALGVHDEWSSCALVNRNCRTFPPDLIRFIGGNVVRNAVLRKERSEAQGVKPAWLDVRLASLAPSGLEDKS